MSFQPIVLSGGFLGYQFLQRTLETQQAAFNESTVNTRLTDYFEENIGSVTSAADLVADRRLLEVALGAFGLDDDINNKFFVEKILDDGVLSDDALSNRLADKRYREFAKEFGFGDFSIPNTQLSTFADGIIEKFQTQRFEAAVGAQNDDMRLALNAGRAAEEIASGSTSADGKWFEVMGNPPLRSVFETALGLPGSFAQLDIDKQLEVFQERAEASFGDSGIEQFTDPEKQEDLVRLFLVRSQAATIAATSAGSVALTLLQSSTLRF